MPSICYSIRMLHPFGPRALSPAHFSVRRHWDALHCQLQELHKQCSGCRTGSCHNSSQSIPPTPAVSRKVNPALSSVGSPSHSVECLSHCNSLLIAHLCKGSRLERKTSGPNIQKHLNHACHSKHLRTLEVFSYFCMCFLVVSCRNYFLSFTQKIWGNAHSTSFQQGRKQP